MRMMGCNVALAGDDKPTAEVESPSLGTILIKTRTFTRPQRHSGRRGAAQNLADPISQIATCCRTHTIVLDQGHHTNSVVKRMHLRQV